MAGYIRSPATFAWAFLVLATLVSSRLAAAPVLVLLIAVTKCRVVMRSYMEVRFAPAWLQLTCDAWLALNFAMASSSYWLAL
ncbi:MAG TPA: hypothetical protein VK509_09110 [Polyangiales bacterium]|nr:hypothetical protein [Polyangiales bacterium]